MTQNVSVDQDSTDPNKNKNSKGKRNFSIWSFASTKKTTKSQEQIRIAKESKAAKKLSFVVGCFILSWLPFFIMYVLQSILPANYFNIDLVNAITWLGYFNSAINPIIYAFLSNPFRNAFYRLTFGIFKNKKQMKNAYLLPSKSIRS